MTETRPKIVAGIDVGKTALELSVAAGPARSYAYNAEGIADLVDGLAGCWHGPVDLAKREPTGGYEKPAAALRAAGTPKLKAHPNRIRAYARVCGALTKTDRPDAQALSRYGPAFAPPPQPEPTIADGEAAGGEPGLAALAGAADQPADTG